ncbi:T9SS type B sorting domain-containing protein [Flavobacterium azooxidireducens]|uniref:T9SS type B sorting domain-containing protein n=1 Tax=Flavobacterium azooxidireducens TaxID=1871076 RepID=A0ABY4KIC1_9FLAO|nr:T9SS type B sorting domain-containing protein [Flavobacterium azooxidireducens]UPQ80568.1 T9SS type B sorting domain-containing protein [Flavobacterium azooxidireducens]
MNFSDGLFQVLNDGSMDTPAGCASISDKDGNLLFYTNGRVVWNRNHEIIEDAFYLANEIEDIQTTIIIPKPNDESTYYIFSAKENQVNGLIHSIIRFTPEFPLGYLEEQNILMEREPISRIAAIHHAESNTIRLITFGKEENTAISPRNTFRVYNITENGISAPQVYTQDDQALGPKGTMKISPNGERIAVTDYDNMLIYLYDFNNENNTFSLSKKFSTTPRLGLLINPYGLEFSQNSDVLYYSGNNFVVQVELNPIEEPYLLPLFTVPNAKSMQLARNGKIYIAQGTEDNPSGRISVINKPHLPAEACDFQENAVSLNPNKSTRGLPIFVASFLRNRIIIEDDCVDAIFNFELDAYAPIQSVLWDFGDGTTSTLMNPTHQFSTSGMHFIKATIVINDYPVVLYKDLEVYPLPSLDPNQVLIQCDSDNDGVSFFNLEEIGNKMNNPNPDYEYYFYKTLNDATLDTNQIEGHETYQNQTNPEEIFVKIISLEGCESISNFFIESSYIVLDPIANMYICEDSDNVLNNGEGTFNIGFKEDEIRNLFGIPLSSTVSFFESEQDAQTKANPIEGRYFTTSTTTIWVRIENDDFSCGGIGPIQLIVNDEIVLDIQESYIICDPLIQPAPVLDGGIANNTWIWRNSAGIVLSNSRQFTLTESGNYSVTVTKTQNGIQCTVTKNFSVRNTYTPVFRVVTVDDNQIYVSVTGFSLYEFSINGFNYYGEGTSYTFTNVPPGLYTVYVRDINKCETPISTEVFILSFPKYFTPNGDGENDYWKLSDEVTNLYPDLKIYIYNRYGILLFYMDSNNILNGWDGTFNGKSLPASDYWYSVYFDDGRNMKGHFSLKR